jgi:hypothetical protein
MAPFAAHWVKDFAMDIAIHHIGAGSALEKHAERQVREWQAVLVKAASLCGECQGMDNQCTYYR